MEWNLDVCDPEQLRMLKPRNTVHPKMHKRHGNIFIEENQFDLALCV